MKKPSDLDCDVLIQQTGFSFQAGHAGICYTQMVALDQLRDIARHAYITGREDAKHKIDKNGITDPD